MRVAGVLHIFQFETKQGEDICMALQVRRSGTTPAPREVTGHPGRPADLAALVAAKPACAPLELRACCASNLYVPPLLPCCCPEPTLIPYPPATHCRPTSTTS